MWLHLIHEGSSGKRIVYWITRSLYVICELFRDTLVVFQKDQKWWNTRLFPAYRRSTSFTEEFRGILNPFWGVDWFWGGKENDKARQAVFFTPLNQFGNDTDEEKLHGDHTVPQKVHYQTCWKRNQDAVYWIHFIQSAGSIITNATVPRDCTDRVISQNWDRVIFERVATPRPAPKVTLKSNWLTKQKQQQQPQQPTLEEGVKAGVRDDTKNATEVEVEPFQKWTLVLISLNIKSSQMHSRITKRMLKNSNEWKLVRTKCVFAKTYLRKDGVQQRI